MCISRNLNKRNLFFHWRQATTHKALAFPGARLLSKFFAWSFLFSCEAYFTHVPGLEGYSLWKKVPCPYLFGTYSLLVGDGGFRVFLGSKPHKHMIKTEDLGEDVDFFWKIFCCLFEFMKWGQDFGSQKCTK